MRTRESHPELVDAFRDAYEAGMLDEVCSLILDLAAGREPGPAPVLTAADVNDLVGFRKWADTVEAVV